MNMGLRPRTIEKIKAILDKSEFSKYMFDILSDSNDLIKIEFKQDSDITFRISEKSKIEMTDGSVRAGYHDPALYLSYITTSAFDTIEEMAKPKPANTIFYFQTMEAPGELASIEEIYECDSLQAAINRVAKWTSRIFEDLKLSQPIEDDLEKLRQDIESTIKADFESSNDAFNDEEKETLHKKLDALKAKLEKLYEEQKESKNTIKVMKEQLTKLQNNISILDKRTWKLNSFNKIFDLVSKAVKFKKNVQKLKDNISFLLTDNPNEPLEQIADETLTEKTKQEE